jgi:hypothetical protein
VPAGAGIQLCPGRSLRCFRYRTNAWSGLIADRAPAGGWVAGLEPDTEAAICYPPHPAFERLCEIFTVGFSRNGADPHIGAGWPSCTAKRA